MSIQCPNRKPLASWETGYQAGGAYNQPSVDWNLDCMSTYHSDQRYLGNPLPGSTTSCTGSNGRCSSCTIIGWPSSAKQSCCAVLQDEMTARDCDPNWCLFSDQCRAATAAYCAAPDPDHIGSIRIEHLPSNAAKPSCYAGSAWATAFPDDYREVVSGYCSDPANLNKLVCKEYCAEKDSNCDAAQLAYTSVEWNAATTEAQKRAVTVDPYAACFLDSVSPGFYANLYQDAAKLSDGFNGLPVEPSCIYPPCASSLYKASQDKSVPGGLRCPAVQQCISINSVTSGGSITGPVSLSNNNNCSFSGSACNPESQYLASVACSTCTDTATCVDCPTGRRNICSDCPAGQRGSEDMSRCVPIPSSTPTPTPTPAPVETPTTGWIERLKEFVTRNKAILLGVVGLVIGLILLAGVASARK